MVAVNLKILFEAFNKDFLLEIYQYKPDLLKDKNVILNSIQILNFNSKKDIIHFLARRKINLIGRKGIEWLNKRIKNITHTDMSKNFPEWEDLKEFYDLRNEIVHNQSILPEKYDKNIKPIDEDRKKIELEYNSLKKYSNAVINYFNYILKNIVYPEKKER